MKKVLYMFGRLSDADVDWLIAKGEKQSISPGDPFIREDQDVDAIYIVLSGHFSVRSKGTEIATLGWGEVVGEMSFVDTAPAAATVTALEPAQLLRIPRRRLESKMNSDTGFAARFYRGLSVALSDRLRDAMHQMHEGGGARVDEYELSPEILDTVHVAGARFDRLLKSVMGSH